MSEDVRGRNEADMDEMRPLLSASKEGSGWPTRLGRARMRGLAVRASRNWARVGSMQRPGASGPDAVAARGYGSDDLAIRAR